MSLDLRGTPIFTWPEWIELSREINAETPVPPALVALSLGEEVHPFHVYSALEIGCRLAAGENERAHDLLDRAVARLKAGFPDDVP